MIALIYGVCIFVMAVSIYTDWTSLEVPDWLSYSGIFAGIGLRLIWSLYSFDWSYLVEGLFGLGVFFGLGCLMFYTGQWGGGDSKLLMAAGALIGFRLSWDSAAVAFLVNLLIAGGILGLVWSAVKAVQNWKKFMLAFRKLLERHQKIRALSLGFAFGSLIFAFFVSAALIRFFIIFLAFFAPFIVYLILAVKAVEFCCMYKRVKPQELTEGDWIVKDIKVKGKRICGPKDLGIDKKQINQLIRAKVKSVLIKQGIPFTLSFLPAFLLTLWIGNPLLFLL